MTMTSNYATVWNAHEEVAQRMVDMIREAGDDPGLESTNGPLLELARSVEHPAILACILAVQQANLLDAYMHDLGEH